MDPGGTSNILEEWFTDISKDFMRYGNCVGMDVNLFFPFKGESINEALKACNGTADHPACPVKDRCLEYAMSLPNLCVGIWGGTSHKQRRAMRSERDKARKAAKQQAAQTGEPRLAELVRLVSEVNRGAA